MHRSTVRPDSRGVVVTHEQFEVLSNQAVAACAVVYFLAFLAHLAQWAAGRSVETTVAEPWPSVPGPIQARPARRRGRHGRGVRADGPFGRIGVALTVVAAFVHFIAIVARGLAADPVRVPWGNMYGFTLTGTWVVVMGYLLLYRRFALSWLSPVVTGFVLVTLMVDVLVLYTPVVPLRDALQSPWLVIHVVAAIIATAAFTLGGMCSALYLLKERWEKQAATGRSGWLPGAVAAARGARPHRLPHARLRVPDLDLRRADRRPDLGALRLGSLLGLGPQGGVGVHHLGGVRRLPARAGHVRVEGPLGRDGRPRRAGHTVVQLRGDQLLLRQRQPALVRRAEPTAVVARSSPDRPATPRLRLVGSSSHRGRRRCQSSSRRNASSSSGPMGPGGIRLAPLPPPRLRRLSSQKNA